MDPQGYHKQSTTIKTCTLHSAKAANLWLRCSIALLKCSPILHMPLQDFEAQREEIKNRNSEEYNVLKIQLEGIIEELERHFEQAHRWVQA